ncbi:hypothetical protein EY643_17090 [Halioglobus maricola]|uniref:Aminoglycoside phosphotransferase domain-containing protein n=1 Tax=Halioglobus maricola TaxID=2601894 RepID=A0A5P9NPM7_9GAMM|nr:choline/ethanolamine kinase family protein [Halioglobus maricola]QFU77234.1 hypothetical protein EY643_17090 [Halioglobus maricola]
MATSLPHAIQLKLEQALGQWRQWQCEPALDGAPLIERILAGGHSNWSVLVGTMGRQFVVRVDGVNPAANGINRQHEWTILQSAAEAALAPVPRYFNPDLGVLVCDYLPPEPEQRVDLQALACLLREIHRLPVRHHRLDLAARLASYDKQIQRENLQAWVLLQPHREAVARQFQVCAAEEGPSVLCHNDLLQANRLYSGGTLYALDWEYAANASPWHELAVVVHGDDLTEPQATEVLQYYLQRDATAEEWLRLQRHGYVYRYLELAWYLAQERELLDEEALAYRTTRLTEVYRELSA